MRKWAYIKGILGEYYALAYLWGRGYRCVHHRYKTPVGEVDLVVKKRRKSPIDAPVFVLVEVKVRKNIDDAYYAITNYQKRRYLNAGRYIHKKYNGVNVRYDAILISGLQIKHIENCMF